MTRVPDEQKIYARGFPSGTVEPDIRDFFSRCGTIVDVYMKDSNGLFAFIGFDNKDDVEEALKLNGSDFMGAPLTVERKNVKVPSEKKCFSCGREGHISSRCPYGGREGVRTCFLCHKTGHVRSECPGPRSPRRSRSRDRDHDRDRHRRRSPSRSRSRSRSHHRHRRHHSRSVSPDEKRRRY